MTPFVGPSVARQVFYRSTNDSDTLKHAVGVISALNPNLRTYRPGLAVIVTWISDVGYQEGVCVTKCYQIKLSDLPDLLSKEGEN